MDAIKSFGESLPSYQRQSSTAMLMPPNMKTFPLYISALLKSDAFRYLIFDLFLYFYNIIQDGTRRSRLPHVQFARHKTAAFPFQSTALAP